jgi:hypothetical protein
VTSRPAIDLYELEQLLRRVRRRDAVRRCLTGLGVGVIAGLPVAAVLCVAFATTAGIVALALCAACGVLFTLIRSPSSADVALRIDRQLQTRELFSTAWSVRESTRQPHRSIVAAANARAGAVSASDLVPLGMPARLCGTAFLLTIVAIAFVTLWDGSASESIPPPLVDRTSERGSTLAARPAGVTADARRTQSGGLPTDDIRPDAPVESLTGESTRRSGGIDSTGEGIGTAASATSSRLPDGKPTQHHAARYDVARAGAGAVGPRKDGDSTPASGIASADVLSAIAGATRQGVGPSPADIDESAVPDRARDLVRLFFDLDEHR